MYTINPENYANIETGELLNSELKLANCKLVVYPPEFSANKVKLAQLTQEELRVYRKVIALFATMKDFSTN